MSNTLFDIEGIYHFKVIYRGHSTKPLFAEMLKRLRQALRSYLILHSDKAPAQNVPSGKKFVAQNAITEMGHAPCSPQLASYYLRLSSKEMSTLNRRIFWGIKDI